MAKLKPKAQSKGLPRKATGGEKGGGKGKKGKLDEIGEGEKATDKLRRVA